MLPDYILSPPSWTRRMERGDLFDGPEPLELDLGCGKGRFLAARAQACPDRNFLGVDRLLRRLKKTACKLKRAGLSNARLLRIESSYAATYLLPPKSVSACYIFFPDPWPKRRHHRRRLFTPRFVDALYSILVVGGAVHIATDHADYCADIRRMFERNPRFVAIPPFVPADHERSEFELIAVEAGIPVNRCSFGTVA